jgi:hypothetical protein
MLPNLPGPAPGALILVEDAGPAPPEVVFNDVTADRLTSRWASDAGLQVEEPDDPDSFSAEGLHSLGYLESDGFTATVKSGAHPVMVYLAYFDTLDNSGVPVNRSRLDLWDSESRDLKLGFTTDSMVVEPVEAVPPGTMVIVLYLEYGLTEEARRWPGVDPGANNTASWGLTVPR